MTDDPIRVRLLMCVVFWILLLRLAGTTVFGQALNESCVVTVSGRSANVQPDGSFSIANIPASANAVRVEAVCTPEGLTLFGASEFFQVAANQTTPIDNVPLSLELPPTLVSIAAVAADTTLKSIGATTQISVTGTFSDGTTDDLSTLAEGTTYLTSNPSVASVDQDGLVVANGVGTAFITAANQGAVSVARVEVFVDAVMTTIEGFVQLENGTPVEGAGVTALVIGGMDTTDAQGFFSFPVTTSAAHTITVVAQATMGNQTFVGTVAGLTPVPGGITDAGIIMVGLVCDEMQWTPGFGLPDVNGPVDALTVFDDGTGPALYAGGDFTTAGGVAAVDIAKWDGTTWWPLGSGTNRGNVYALTVFDDDGPGPNLPALYAGGGFTTAGGVAANYIARWDGTTWWPLGSGMNNQVFALTVFDDDGPGPNLPALYAGGGFTTAGGVAANHIARWDGSTWSPLGSGMNSGTVEALTVFDDDGPGPNLPALYAGGSFITAGGITVNRIARWDGSAWSPLGSGMSGIVRALTVFDDDGPGPNLPALYAGGSFITAGGVTVNRIARWDGSAWSLLGSGMNNQVFALTVFDDDGPGPNLPALYAGGGFTTAGGITANRIARWDGLAWSPLGGGISGNVRALTVFDDDGLGPNLPALYAGGVFTTAGDVTASNIAKWDDSAWSALGSGMNNDVHALTVFDDDGPGLNLPALYAGGSFITAGGVAANYIARWDGSAWSLLGSGMNNAVQALTVFDDDGPGPNLPALFAGGNFITAGGVTVNRIAGWDGSTWSSLGSGTSSTVNALTVFDDDGPGPNLPALFAGGSFITAGGVSAVQIARWDGTNWSPLGSGMNNDVRALTVFDDDGPGPNLPALYAGGDFTSAGGVSAVRIARWDGSAWSPLGSGMSGFVRALTVFDDGTGPALYAGGNFATAGGTAASRIARWDGSAWSSLGIGMNNDVYSLTDFDDGTGPALNAGGSFTTAGGVSAVRIARWDGSTWWPLGSGMSGFVRTLTVFDDGTGPALYAGGEFTTAGGIPSANVARWACVP